MLQRSLRSLKNSHYIFSSRCFKLHTSAFPVLHSKFDKDLPNPNFPTPINKLYGPDTDILLGQLKKCNSADRLLELINMHLDVMNSKHIVACMETIYDCVKCDSSLSESLKENPIFKSFSARLMKVVRVLEPHEVITVYKAYCSLEVRSNTYVMQCILKMLGAHLNNMSLGQLTFLSFLLHRQRHNALIDGLRLAIPLVLQVQIDQQLDSDNLKEVVNCLQLCCRSALKPATIQKIVNVIIKKASFLSTEEAITVIFSLLNIDTPIDGYNELINAAFEVVSKNVEDVTPIKICAIIRTCHHQRFYHVKFFFSVAEIITSQKWNLEETYSALSHLFSLGFCPPVLTDHFSEALCLESKEYQSNDLYSPLNCIEFLTATSYRPANIDEAARVLYSNKNKIENLRSKSPHLFLKFISCLAMIGHFPCEFLSKLLNEDYLFNVWTFSRKLGRGTEFDRYMLSLFWSLKLYDETENFTISPAALRKIINSVYQKSSSNEYPLTKFLENGLGGSQFLQSGVYTEDGLVIDNIVAMRSGSYPLSLQKYESKSNKEKKLEHFNFIENITLPEDAKIIAVLVAKEEDYFRDPEILKSWMDLKVKTLTKKKYAVVVINYPVWKNLPDREKIPYLMHEIKQVVQDISTQRSNYS